MHISQNVQLLKTQKKYKNINEFRRREKAPSNIVPLLHVMLKQLDKVACFELDFGVNDLNERKVRENCPRSRKG